MIRCEPNKTTVDFLGSIIIEFLFILEEMCVASRALMHLHLALYFVKLRPYALRQLWSELVTGGDVRFAIVLVVGIDIIERNLARKGDPARQLCNVET